jgi:hypothetical protein
MWQGAIWRNGWNKRKASPSKSGPISDMKIPVPHRTAKSLKQRIPSLQSVL